MVIIKKLFSKFVEPANFSGDWVDQRQVHFWHDGHPIAVKYVVEKITATLLQRDQSDARQLSYCGCSDGSGTPREVCLRFEAVIDSRKLYSLQVKRSTPKKWASEAEHLRAAGRTMAFWSAKLFIASPDIAWSRASSALYDQCRRESLALEEVMANAVEDPAPIAALQKEVLDALRAGMGFFTANKEGGTHLFFNGRVFVRSDYGDEPNVNETYAADAAMVACLRRFFDWESRRDWYPHRPPELDVWKYIKGRLVQRHA